MAMDIKRVNMNTAPEAEYTSQEPGVGCACMSRNSGNLRAAGSAYTAPRC